MDDIIWSRIDKEYIPLSDSQNKRDNIKGDKGSKNIMQDVITFIL